MKKALILYASTTGNTEKIAKVFEGVLTEYGWEVDILKVLKSNFESQPYRVDDYDLVLAGSPIINGIPAKVIYDDKNGIMTVPLLKREHGSFNPIDEYYCKKTYGIAFVTYTGNRRGPAEAINALTALELKFDDLGIRTIGKLATPGRIAMHNAVDDLSGAAKIGIEEAAAAIAEYKKNPEADMFSKLSPELRKLYDNAAKDDRGDLPPSWTRKGMWHWNQQSRPNDRDFLKAKIFLEEIIEDYYEGDVIAAPYATYIAMS